MMPVCMYLELAMQRALHRGVYFPIWASEALRPDSLQQCLSVYVCA